MKKFTALFLALTLLFLLSACSPKVDESHTPITLCLDWTPNTNHTGFFAAEALGYYERAGLNVTIVQPPEDGAELMTASGQAQFGISFQDTLAPVFAEDKMGITAVAALLQHNTSGIISLKSDGISSPELLEGKKYSTWNGSVELAMVREIMEKQGGDFSKLQLIPNVVTNEAQALINDDTDAIWIFYAWAGISCELQGLDFNYFSFTDIDPVFDYYTPVIIGNNQFLEENPEAARAFLRATREGYLYAIENPDEAAQLLIEGDTTGSLRGSQELVTASQRWISKQYLADAEDWGKFDMERWDSFYQWLYEKSLISKEIPAGKGATNDYLILNG